MKLVLASRSPRRSEILENAGFSFAVRTSDGDESPNLDLPFGEMVMSLASEKLVGIKRQADEVLLAADTIVVLDNSVLGKPLDRADGVRMLRSLSGRDHLVYTGVSLDGEKGRESFYSCTSVRFYSLSESEIQDYLDTGEPFDKAGAYGIQGRGSLLVEEIKGDFFNVMGLPIAKTARLLKDFGVFPDKI